MQRKGNRSIVFCFLLNRVHFSRDSAFSTVSVSRSRASLCEILAMRLLQEWDDVLDLAAVTTIAWPVFAGADPEVLAKADEYGDGALDERVGACVPTLRTLLMITTKAMQLKWRSFLKPNASSSHRRAKR